MTSEWQILAGVRFLLALGIANYHLVIVGPHQVLLLSALGSHGCICGFLAISGYSIAHSISTQPEGFLRRRAWRVLPIYYVAMGLSLVPYLFLPDPTGVDPFTAPEILGSLVLLQGFVVFKIPIFGPSWTLSIEWWFYVLAPLFLRLRWSTLAALVVVSVVVEDQLMSRGVLPIHLYRWGIPAIMLLWAWLLGFLFYEVRGWAGPVLVVVGFWGTERSTEPPAGFVLAAGALTMARGLPQLSPSIARGLSYLGDLSYPLYLVHVPLMFWVSRFTTWKDPALYLCLSLVFAALLHHGLDAPLRGRFSVRRSVLVAQ